MCALCALREGSSPPILSLEELHRAAERRRGQHGGRRTEELSLRPEKGVTVETLRIHLCVREGTGIEEDCICASSIIVAPY